MTRLIFALLASSFGLMSAGCGQSGPLYLPGNPSQIQNPSATTPDADEEKENKEDDGETPQG
jgi:predicted small lipoprotein YifL